MTVEEVNKLLDEYTDKNCLNCYARITDQGRVHLDHHFKINHLKDIMTIIDQLVTNGE
jgi:iron uptake system EfeUOB component EfeO/EfeM